MRINHNIASLNTYRQLSANGANTQKSLEKLSSGLRINRAGDDAAGLAISEKMRGQIRGLDQAQRNSQDAISLIQTAEGALSETHSILQRMRELAVQSANDTNTSSDRTNIQTEINQLTSEINRIGNTTEFNTQKLLDGSASAKTVTPSAVGANLGNVTGLSASNVANGNYTMTVKNIAAAKDATLGSGGAVTAGGGNNATGADVTALASINAGRANGAITYSGTVYATVTTGGADGTAVLKFGSTAGASDLGAGISWAASGTAMSLTGAANGVQFTLSDGASANTLAAGDTFTFTVASADTQQHYEADLGGTVTNFSNNSSGVTVTGGNGTISFNSGDVSSVAVGTPQTITLAIADGTGKSMQIGANQNQIFGVGINDMRAAALAITGSGSSFTTTAGVTNGTSTVASLKGLDVSTAEKAGNAISVLDSATALVSNERSKLGAYQNRLEHTINNLGTSSENLTAAESRIRDVDMAKEMMEFTKNNILSQAAQAMLAQANQQPQGVLQLLR